ncbi:MAG: PIG-L family deacetylase, partial [Deltaproteobacteria bacterium]|nr:PIG-L family deacetylase [Deltaproteobacteria bacterium]
MTVWLWAVLGAAGGYAALNFFAATWNRYWVLPSPAAFPSVTRLLVVAPHQDDEAIMAGGLMARLVRSGGDV